MNTTRRFLLIAGALCAFAGLQAQNLRPEANEKGKFGYVNDRGEKVIAYKYTEANPFEEGLAKVKKGDKYGFIDPKGKEVGKIKYTLILPFTGSFCRVAVGGSYKEGILKGAKWGFLNKRGEEILSPKYDEIGEFEDGVAYVIAGKKYGLVDDRAKFLLQPKYVAVGLFDKFGHCWFASSGKVDKKSGKLFGAKYGLINRDGKIVIPAKYPSLGYFYKFRMKGLPNVVEYSASISSIYTANSLSKPLSRLFDPQAFIKASLINTGSKVKGSEDMSKPMQDAIKKMGINLDANLSIDNLKNIYENVDVFTNGDFLYYQKGINKYGVMNSQGDIVIPDGKYQYLNCPSDGIALVGRTHKKKLEWGYYNVESGYLKEFGSGFILQSYTDGVGKVQKSDGMATFFVDKSGNKITDEFRMAMNFDNGVCIVQDNAGGKFGVIDNKGKSIIPFEYDAVLPYFSEELLSVCKNGKWGVSNRNGSLVIPLIYKNVTNFKQGWAAAQNEKGKWGMINKENQSVVPFEWEDLKLVDEPTPGYVWGKDAGLWYCYDLKKKNLAFGNGFEDASNFKDNFAYVAMGGKYGLVNLSGDIIVPCKMDNYSRLKNAMVYMEKLGKTSLNDTDAFRLNIYEDTSVNSFKITDRIPDEKWDY